MDSEIESLLGRKRNSSAALRVLAASYFGADEVILTKSIWSLVMRWDETFAGDIRQEEAVDRGSG